MINGMNLRAFRTGNSLEKYSGQLIDMNYKIRNFRDMKSNLVL